MEDIIKILMINEILNIMMIKIRITVNIR